MSRLVAAVGLLELIPLAYLGIISIGNLEAHERAMTMDLALLTAIPTVALVCRHWHSGERIPSQPSQPCSLHPSCGSRSCIHIEGSQARPRRLHRRPRSRYDARCLKGLPSRPCNRRSRPATQPLRSDV